MILAAIITWYISGLIIVLNEMRYDMDVTLAWFLCACGFAILGPFWLIKTIFRITNGYVIFRQVKKDEPKCSCYKP